MPLDVNDSFEGLRLTRRQAATWEPCAKDDLESALGEAAEYAGVNLPDAQWCLFLEAASCLLCPPAPSKAPARPGCDWIARHWDPCGIP